jgi:hypothetical protein
MSDLFSKSNLATSQDTPNATSSPESEDGPTPSDSQDGPMIDQSGPEAVPVSRFRARDSKKAMTTNDTSGPLFTSSSPSADLQRSLENRLRQNLDVNGSQEYALTWKTHDMPSGLPICALRASARRTYVNACGGAPPTLTARDYRSGMSAENLTRRKLHPRGVNLNEFMQRALGRPGKLNPRFGLLWMGYPIEWAHCAARAMPSSRKLRQSSYAPR